MTDRWSCAGCGAGLWREFAAPAEAAPHVVHCCGACKTLHVQEGAGLRRLTAAERFELELRLEGLLRAIEATTFPASRVASGTLIIPED